MGFMHAHVIDLLNYNFFTLWLPTLKCLLDKTEFKAAAIVLFFSFQFKSFQNQNTFPTSMISDWLHSSPKAMADYLIRGDC